MSAWQPKTSKLGGLPSITFENHKPIELGSMLKNSIECIIGVFKYQDIVQSPEVQQQQKYYGNPLSVSNSGTIPSHTSKVLQHVEGSNLSEGAWVGGDAWFGSFTTAVEVCNKFKVVSTWVIKNNTFLYPMDALYVILKARHKKKCLGHWVGMKSQFEEKFGCVAWKDIPIPEFAEFIFINLPLIDEHNKK
eukprot:4567274-Ditylum_brightwellii.AAC.2